MADLSKQFNDFKDMLNENNVAYVELPMQTLIAKRGNKLNIRLYHEDFCLSSWVDMKTFKEKINTLEGIENGK